MTNQKSKKEASRRGQRTVQCILLLPKKSVKDETKTTPFEIIDWGIQYRSHGGN